MDVHVLADTRELRREVLLEGPSVVLLVAVERDDDVPLYHSSVSVLVEPPEGGRLVLVRDGDVDVLRVLRILKQNGFEGVVIPDHAPQMACAAPWQAGMAYALGYLRAGMQGCGV